MSLALLLLLLFVLCGFVSLATLSPLQALGDYTRMISDFSVLPSEPNEGRVGTYWYHEDTQAFFDDVDHYKMIVAMCRLSCSVCDNKTEEQPSDGPKRRPRLFRNIEQLKGHLFHQHKLFMCSLCLEGRKASHYLCFHSVCCSDSLCILYNNVSCITWILVDSYMSLI